MNMMEIVYDCDFVLLMPHLISTNYNSTWKYTGKICRSNIFNYCPSDEYAQSKCPYDSICEYHWEKFLEKELLSS